MENSDDRHIEQLRQAVEQTIGRKMVSPKDFNFLSEDIYERLHQNISTSTLKRVWGYVQQYATIRRSTLNLLSQYVGYDDWEQFCSTASEETGQNTPAEENTAPVCRTVSRKWWVIAAVAVAMALVIVVGWGRILRKTTDSIDDYYIIKAGQSFDSPNDYLKRFGIVSNDSNYWDQPLPHYPQVIIWSPQYRHPVWHNYGNPDSLMPTITEYWKPDDLTVSEQTVTDYNCNLYFTVMRTNELRITFMKNLVDSNYVFLGIYRVRLDSSDASHIVWERISDICDLRHLDYLEQLRN